MILKQGQNYRDKSYQFIKTVYMHVYLDLENIEMIKIIFVMKIIFITILQIKILLQTLMTKDADDV